MLDKDTVKKVSVLARLRLNEGEVEECSKVLSAVLESFEQIAQVDTHGVEPLVTPTDMAHTIRPDIAEQVVTSDKLLENAAAKSGRLFKVPPVV